MRALILGSAGMLGADLSSTAPEGASVVALDVADVDITDRAQVARVLDEVHPDWVINAAAYTAVDRAETERESAEAVNARGPRHIGEEAARRRIAVVHFSTDYVFAGSTRTAYRETDPVEPVNAYGESKLRGEEAVLSSGARSLIVRTQWLFGRAGRSFPRTMWDRASARMPTRVVDDQIGRPTYTRDLAAATWRLVTLGVTGIVHVTNSGEATSWYGLAREVFISAKAELLLSACATAEYPTPARRPAYSVLCTERLEGLLSEPLPDWHDALRRFLDEISAPVVTSPDATPDRT